VERHEGPQTPYEVYCYDCRVTFPVGTRNCVHCGRRLGGRELPRSAGRAEPMEVAEEDAMPSVGRRIGGASLWILIALAAALTRMCSER
jgi:hypothetical protein